MTKLTPKEKTRRWLERQADKAADEFLFALVHHMTTLRHLYALPHYATELKAIYDVVRRKNYMRGRGHKGQTVNHAYPLTKLPKKREAASLADLDAISGEPLEDRHG